MEEAFCFVATVEVPPEPEQAKKKTGSLLMSVLLLSLFLHSVCEDGYSSSLEALKPGGKLVCIDAVACLAPDNSPVGGAVRPYLSTFFGQTPSAKLHMFRASYLLGEDTELYDLFDRFDENPGEYAHDLKKLFGMLRDGTVRPHIVRTVPLRKVANAHAEIERGGVNGHIVCTPFMDEEGGGAGGNASAGRTLPDW